MGRERSEDIQHSVPLIEGRESDMLVRLGGKLAAPPDGRVVGRPGYGTDKEEAKEDADEECDRRWDAAGSGHAGNT